MKHINLYPILASIGVIAMSNATLAQSVDLNCLLNDGEESISFQVNIDTPSRKVTHTKEDGLLFNADAFISADTITYQRAVASEPYFTVVELFKIDRTTLVAEYHLNYAARDPALASRLEPLLGPKNEFSTGLCEIIETPKRLI